MDAHPLLVKAYRLINLYNSTQKRPHTYSGDLVLYPAQAHMIELIGDEEGITLSEIAAEYMITKGAVSQTVSFLEQKELIYRKPSEKGGRSVGLYLSERGRDVLSEHRELHSDMIRRVGALAEQLPPESVSVLEQIADVIESNIRNM